jgi:hypothetical protein
VSPPSRRDRRRKRRRGREKKMSEHQESISAPLETMIDGQD